MGRVDDNPPPDQSSDQSPFDQPQQVYNEDTYMADENLNPSYVPPQSPQNFPPPEAYPPQKPAAYPQQQPPVHFPPQPHQQPPVQFPPQPQQQQPVHFPPQPQQQQFPPQQQHVQFQPQNYNHGQPQAVNYGTPVKTEGIAIGSQYLAPTQPWSATNGLFDCANDPENAIITACFPCITYGQIAEIVDNGQTSCTTSGLIYCLIASFIGIPCIISCSYRTKIRNRYGLMETPAPDWITHCFCEWCALCQEYRELKARGLDPAIGWQGNMMRNQQMQQYPTMTPPMNQRMM